MGSRWADTAEDVTIEAQRKREKEEKKRAKLEKQRKLEEAEAARRKAQEEVEAAEAAASANDQNENRPAKRRRLSTEAEDAAPTSNVLRPLLRFETPSWQPCRHVSNFETLNPIDEGTYGWVTRARETGTGEVVALKKFKMEGVTEGFPLLGLREIQTLKASRGHENIVDLREIVVGNTLQDVYLVMEFLEHDLKTLMEDMTEPFLPSEIKTLLIQLSSAVSFLHSNWILHRDLKTSNILMNNLGTIKLADFGMARSFSSPPPSNLTQLVVTLWYRSPELLLGAETYGTEIDMWSVGCIFGELLAKDPILQGSNEVSQLTKIFELCGVPTEESWPGFRRLPNARSLRLPRNAQTVGSVVRAKFPFLTGAGAELLNSLLALNPADRPSADEVLQHPYFKEDPRPKASAMFPTFPSKAGQEKRRRRETPQAPKRGEAPKLGGQDLDFSGIFANRDEEEKGAGFQLKFA